MLVPSFSSWMIFLYHLFGKDIRKQSLVQICPDFGIAFVLPKLAVMHLVPSSSDPETAHSLN